MRTRFSFGTPVLAAAGATAVLLGIGLGLFLFRGPGELPQAPQTDETSQQADAPPICTGDAVMTKLDDSKVPAPGSALEGALKNVVARYFACKSLPSEQFARVFSTLSVVIAQYATDPKCFTDDDEPRSATWQDHKTWADQQAGVDVLLVNLRVKIGSALACLQPDQQRLFFVDMAHAFVFAAAAHAKQSFVNPTFRGERVDHCLNYGRDCDTPAATTWCSRFGYSRITSWEWNKVPRTATLGDGQVCQGSCGAFTSIVCER